MLKPRIALCLALLNISLVVRCHNVDSIIIVGAGAAGIAAASKLLENNFNNITILEAENRTGGRILTVPYEKGVTDLGGQWCEGTDGNIVYDLSKDFDLLEKEIDPVMFFKHSICYSTREELDIEFVGETFKIFWDIYEVSDPEVAVTYAEYLPHKYNEKIREKYGNDTKKLKLSSELLDLYIKGALSNEGAFSFSDVSAMADFKDIEGGELYWKKGGSQNILDILMHKYPDPSKELPVLSNTLLNKEVTKITWNDDQDLVTVDCSDGSSYSAHHVIVTPSLGVLKHHYKTLFQPSLPPQKIDAIEDLGIGAVLKVVLYYSKIWWPEQNSTGFSFAWSEEDRKNLVKEYPYGPSQDGNSWLLNAFGAFFVRGHPHLLMVWFAGPLIPEIEKLTNEEIVKGVNFLFNKFIGHRFKVIPTPDAVLRNNWYTNDHFRGTYSFQTVKSRQHGTSSELVLSEPLKSKDGKHKVLFAGEATNPIHYATIHGAIETGQREAIRIINLHK